MAIPPAAIVARSPAPRLAATTDAATTRSVHNPLGGILSQHDEAGDWHWALVDGLGSVRGMVDETFGVEGSRGSNQWAVAHN